MPRRVVGVNALIHKNFELPPDAVPAVGECRIICATSTNPLIFVVPNRPRTAVGAATPAADPPAGWKGGPWSSTSPGTSFEARPNVGAYSCGGTTMLPLPIVT